MTRHHELNMHTNTTNTTRPGIMPGFSILSRGLRLACLGLLTVLASLQAQTVTNLLTYGATWRYNETPAAGLGTAWRTNTYNDNVAGWFSGGAVLGFPSTEPYPGGIITTLSAIPNPITVTTYYFRVFFNYNGPTNGVTLLASNYVDGGCVVYLNGLELARVRVPANQTPATMASGGPGTEGVPDVVTTNINNILRSGANLLAVEVHQDGATSSDIAWGMSLSASIPQPISITDQPDSVIAQEGDPVTFSVRVSGSPVFYQWQRSANGGVSWNNLPGQTSSNYNVTAATNLDGSQYRCIVTNTVSSLTSLVASLTVIADTTPPAMLTAIALEPPTAPLTNRIRVQFSEVVDRDSATNRDNWRLVRTGTPQTVTISNIQWNASQVDLVVGGTNWLYRTNYYIEAKNIEDQRGNSFTTNYIGVSWRNPTNVFQMFDEWLVHDSWSSETNIYDQNWTGMNFTPSGFWYSGIGILYKDPAFQVVVCAGDTLGTEVSYQFPAVLFRKVFTIPTNSVVTPSAALRMRHITDDGVLFYLNGREILRGNVAGAPGSPVDLLNGRASSTISNPTCTTNEITVTNLVAGTNVIAAAVLDATDAEGDRVFGLEMDVIALLTSAAPTNPPPPLPAPRFTSVTKLTGTNLLRLAWTNGGSLQFTTNLAVRGSNTVWLNVPGATNSPFTNVITRTNRFFRVIR